MNGQKPLCFVGAHLPATLANGKWEFTSWKLYPTKPEEGRMIGATFIPLFGEPSAEIARLKAELKESREAARRALPPKAKHCPEGSCCLEFSVLRRNLAQAAEGQEFECPDCAVKPVAPTLCSMCLRTRKEGGSAGLRKRIAELEARLGGGEGTTLNGIAYPSVRVTVNGKEVGGLEKADWLWTMDHGHGAMCTALLYAKDDRLSVALSKGSDPTVEIIYETPDGIRTVTFVDTVCIPFGTKHFSLRPLDILANGRSPGGSRKQDARLDQLVTDLNAQTAVATRLANEHAAMSKTLTEAQEAGTKLAEAKRKVEAELAAESSKVGELQTSIDALQGKHEKIMADLRACIKRASPPSTSDEELGKRTLFGSIEALDSRCTALGAEVDALTEDRRHLVERLMELGVGMSFDSRGHVMATTRAPNKGPVMVPLPQNNVTINVADIPPDKTPKEFIDEIKAAVGQSLEDPAPVVDSKPQPFKTLLIGAQPLPEIVPAVGLAEGRFRRTITLQHSDPAWSGLYRKVEKPKQDNCPLPRVNNAGWEWVWHSVDYSNPGGYAQSRRFCISEWTMCCYACEPREPGPPTNEHPTRGLWSWSVQIGNTAAETGHMKTNEGAMRTAEKAARRAWRVLNRKR